ncbi:MAG TPA: ribokinase [Nocardioidaceae bacterium]
MSGRSDRRCDVVVVGSVNRDYVCSSDRLPASGETVLGGEVTVGSGGKGGNQAVSAAYWGATTAIVGCVGGDADGEALRADLEAAGVDTSALTVLSDVRTGCAFVFVAPDGENAIVVAPGANGRVDPANVHAATRRLLRPGGVVVTQAEIPAPAAAAGVAAAAEIGARAIVNLAPYRNTEAGLLQLADPLVVNESEAAGLLGSRIEDVAEARAAAQELARRTRSVVITLGPSGAVLADGVETLHVPAEERAAVDTTGAGDAFTGVVAAALAGGDDLATAVRWGVAAGTYAVGGHGAQASFPRRADIAG